MAEDAATVKLSDGLSSPLDWETDGRQSRRASCDLQQVKPGFAHWFFFINPDFPTQPHLKRPQSAESWMGRVRAEGKSFKRPQSSPSQTR